MLFKSLVCPNMALQNLNKKLTRMDRRGNYRYSKPKSKKGFWKKFFIVLIILFVFIYLPARGVYSSAKKLSSSGKALSTAFKNEDFDAMKSSLKDMKGASDGLNLSLNFYIWMSVIPYFGGFYSDARHFSAALSEELTAAQILTDGLEPYKNDLGFTGHPNGGQDRVAQFVKILDKSLPNMDKVVPQLKAANDDVSSIDVNKYPEKVGTHNVKSLVSTGKGFISGAYVAVTQARPALEAAPSALGEPTAKNYLILFQNDKELRATGGFLTAYAFLNLNQGHISTTDSNDIYQLDTDLLQVCLSKVCPLTPPAPIVKYLPEANGQPRTAWSMRDSNLSPDFPTSMKQFESMYSLLGRGLPFDGIIAIDSQVVEELIKITGPVEVFGTTYSADLDKRCNCPNVIYELENYSEKVAQGQADRKAILGTLMQQIMQKALASSTTEMPQLISAGADLAAGKHLQLYMHDDKMESALDTLNWTGRILPANGDYLAINDSNFAGGKSNLYVTEDVNLTVDKGSGMHTLTINYNNPQPYSNWLNAINRDYFRVYVPQGSQLTYSKGSLEVVSSHDDLGKTYLDGFIQVRPQNSLTVTLQYTTPDTVNSKNPYEILVQKQAGTKDFKYTVKVGGSTKNFVLSSDQTLKF